MEILGIDIGASGIKGAPVDTETGVLVGTRFRLPTPESAKPGPMIEVMGKITRHFKWSGAIGCFSWMYLLSGVIRPLQKKGCTYLNGCR